MEKQILMLIACAVIGTLAMQQARKAGAKLGVPALAIPAIGAAAVYVLKKR